MQPYNCMRPSDPQIRESDLDVQAASDEVAKLLHADPADVVPVVNATAAVNTVLASTQLQPGDLIMTTSITYNAVRLCLGLELNQPYSKLEGRPSSAASGCPSWLELNPFAAYDGIRYKAEA